ncbi:MAG TPA: glycosyltransferase [Vicinamibacteria bacterium]|nr:glycosyltransferase [Vicinamibacteria bacterium]
MPRYLYLDDVRFASLDLSDAPGPARTRLTLDLPGEMGHTTNAQGELARAQVDGLILGLNRGWAGRSHFRLLDQAAARGLPAYFYWPREQAIELVDAARRRLHFRVAVLARLYSAYQGRPLGAADLPEPPDSEGASPAPLEIPESGRVKGRGLYVRLDYWAKVESGGSYGHTCHVARELERRTGSLVAVVPHRFAMLDEFGVPQVVLTNPDALGSERDIIVANRHYYPILKAAFEMERPAYVYERVVLGSFVAARLCRELRIPYIAEYNGSEISLGRSFGSSGYVYERDLLRIEDFVFREATLIVVVSKHIKADLVQRGIEPGRILVNPNGGDPAMYAPGTQEERAKIRESLGFKAEDRVIGFCGTFGGWHGIDVLAAAIPRICEADPNSRFLLIGDGNFKHLVDETVAAHRLGSRVISVGRTTQADGARYQKACDVLISPHSRNMVDGPFFGSPTKLFEYMGYGVGIVASDLEQIGEVLSPALLPGEVGEKQVTSERGVLCRPGDVESFVLGVTKLAKADEVSAALGANARRALLEHFTWSAHVQRIFLALSGRPARVPGISEDVGPNGPTRAHGGAGSEVTARSADLLLEGIAAELGRAPRRVLGFAIENPAILNPLRGSGAEILILEPWARKWSAFIADFGPGVRVLPGSLAAVPASEGAFDLLVTERGFDYDRSPEDTLKTARAFLRGGGVLRARLRLNSAMGFWIDQVILGGLAKKQLGDYSPDEVVARGEEALSGGVAIRTFHASEILRAARAFGEARLRGINVEPTNGPTRALHRMGLGRRAAFLSDLSVRFL